MRKISRFLIVLTFGLLLIGAVFPGGAKEQAAGGGGTGKLVLATDNAPRATASRRRCASGAR